MSRMPNCCLKFSSGSFSRSFSEVCFCSFWWCSFPPVLECFLKTFSEFSSFSLKQDERYLDWECGVSCPWPHFCPFVLWSTWSQTTAGEQAEEHNSRANPCFSAWRSRRVFSLCWCGFCVITSLRVHWSNGCMKFRFPKYAVTRSVHSLVLSTVLHLGKPPPHPPKRTAEHSFLPAPHYSCPLLGFEITA